ncbi:transcriptional coactivator p15/PC4 family protein [Methylobacterium sp. J-030]|uniref:transcriptional coactivator p15/PC4 family protein n=1 Tax=Methylobacterium sp. J-030 TaxID=2836627 RepID=UPI001FB93291|nr:transcriptional coactivator p15/PC4 family protein [Methylobacterium sp. J-030]MCJ2068365.1 transcriptional coactivator p15/PC4 family protein [Methylobacterium sp. J-030]
MSASSIVATVMKNNVEEVRVSLTSFNGFDLVDIRTFARLIGTHGEPMPTKRGVCLGRDRLPELIQALIQAQEGGTSC